MESISAESVLVLNLLRCDCFPSVLDKGALFFGFQLGRRIILCLFYVCAEALQLMIEE